MAFTIRKNDFTDDVKEIKIIPYYDSGICIRIHNDNTYELWNYETIRISTVAKAVDDFLQKNPTIDKIYVKDKIFIVGKKEIRKRLFDFLTEIEKNEL